MINNVQDVVVVINVAFRGAPPTYDPNCVQGAPAERTDVDCSGFTNVVDVVMIVNVAFRGTWPPGYCDPCACNPYL